MRGPFGAGIRRDVLTGQRSGRAHRPGLRVSSPLPREGTKKPESLPESWEQSRARARRDSKGGPGKSRGRRQGMKGLRRDFPQRIPRRRAGRILNPGQGRVLGSPRQRQPRARPPLGLSLRDKTQGSKGEEARANLWREKKKALTDLGRSIRACC